MWMPGDVHIIVMNKRGENVHVMISGMDEDMMEEDDGTSLADEAPDDMPGMCPFCLNDAKPMIMDDLGSHEVVDTVAKELSDAVEEQADEEIVDDNAGLPLGEWVNLPRRSRIISGMNPIDPPDDPNDMECVSMFHIATNDVSRNFSRFDDGLKNGMLKEAVDIVRDRNEIRCWENFIVGHLLNYMSAKNCIIKHGAKAFVSLLEKFSQLHDKDTFEPTDPRYISCKKRRKLLNTILVIKKKDKSLKVRTVANGRNYKEQKKQSRAQVSCGLC